jgi:phosphatidylglycerol lysyltransferase
MATMERDSLLAALRAFGRDAVSYQALEPGLRHWATRGGVVSFCDTSGGWVATGGPLAELDEYPEVASRFVRDAASQGRRASFFACDDPASFGDRFSRLQLGEQPLWHPAEWQDTLRAHRRLREQLRRARAKGVHVRRVSTDELAEGGALRGTIEALAERWLGSRPMEPMSFLLTLALFEEAAIHRYYAAEREGVLVAFLSIVPIGADRGLLVEDLVRDRRAPNGTTELLFDLAMRDAAQDGIGTVTWGLAALAGRVTWPMRAIGALGRGLYDFRGLRAFKGRLHPREWQPVWLVYPRGQLWPLHLLDALRAFAGGSLVRFGWRTVAHRPLLLAWLLTLALIPWTVLLTILLAFHAAVPLFGFPRSELLAWAAFDALFAFLLVRAFHRPRASTYLVLAFAAACDAALASLHLAHVGLGATSLAAIVRIASMVAPTLAFLGLLRCAAHAREHHLPGAASDKA